MVSNLKLAWEWVLKRRWLRLLLIRFAIVAVVMSVPSILLFLNVITVEQYNAVVSAVQTLLPFITL